MSLSFFTDGTNTVIAESVEDALTVYAEHQCEPWTPDCCENESWSEGCCWDRPSTGFITLRFEQFDDVPDYAKGHLRHTAGMISGHILIAMLASEWIAGHGRGFFGSTES